MKLRTKFEDEDFKLGEVVEADIISDFDKDELKIYCRASSGCLRKLSYLSISEALKDWEDYEPVEPIFDEKIRRGIRAWWDMQDNPFKNAAVMLLNKCKDRDGFYHWKIFGYIRNGEERTSTDIEFRTKKLYDYNPSHDYTREELCGEEKECES